MKIGILTYHRSHNYGACLQAYALASWIEKETSVKTEIIDYNTEAAVKFYKKEVIRGKKPYKIISNLKRYLMFEKRGLNNFPLSGETLISDNMAEFFKYIDNKYDVIVAGSDEVWKPGFRGFPNAYFLPEALPCVKMGYAISARYDFSSLGSEKCSLLKKYLDDFIYIGVRDKSTLKAVSKYTSSETTINCDPTFNYDFSPKAENGRRIISGALKGSADKKTVAFMYIDDKKASEIMSKLGDKYNYIALYDAVKGAANLCGITPFEWIDVISAADFLVTNYFHGMCFAIKSNVPFSVVEIRGGKKEDSKSYDLLSECGMAERFFMKEDEQLADKICKLIERDIEAPCDFSDAVKFQQQKSRSFMDRLNEVLKKKRS